MKNLKSSIKVIITAGGSGKRMSRSKKKQYIELSGKPVMARTIQVFEDLKYISGIVLVVPEDDIDLVSSSIIEKYSFKKIEAVIPGGKERQDSVRSGIRHINCKDDDLLIIHDAVRPFITPDVISECIKKAGITGASIAGVIPKDTIKIIRDNRLETLKRDRLFAVQTPQVFKYELIKKCHAAAFENNFISTDDSSLVEKYSQGTDISLVEGGYTNFKITTEDDLLFAEVLLKDRDLNT